MLAKTGESSSKKTQWEFDCGCSVAKCFQAISSPGVVFFASFTIRTSKVVNAYAAGCLPWFPWFPWCSDLTFSHFSRHPPRASSGRSGGRGPRTDSVQLLLRWLAADKPLGMGKFWSARLDRDCGIYVGLAMETDKIWEWVKTSYYHIWENFYSHKPSIVGYLGYQGFDSFPYDQMMGLAC